MKKSSLWAGLIGGLIIAADGYTLANAITNPTNLFWVNVAIIVSNILWIAFGFFLIFIFIKLRNKEDVENGHQKPLSGSPEDIEHLRKQRKIILAFVLIVEAISSAEMWFLNDYTVGLTLINIAVIFDLLLHFVLVYIFVELLRDKKDMMQLLLFSIIAYIGGWIILSVLREHWFTAFTQAIFGLYFIYAIKAPLSRRNHRIAHFIILPAFIILLSTSSFFDSGKIPELTEKELLAEQQFSNEAANLNTAYMLFWQRETPGKADIQDIRSAITKRETKIAEIVSLVEQLKEEYKKQLPSVAQKKNLEWLHYYLLIMDTHRAQAQKVEELMTYAEKVNFAKLTDKQISELRSFKDEIEALGSKLTEIEFERDNANLN